MHKYSKWISISIFTCSLFIYFATHIYVCCCQYVCNTTYRPRVMSCRCSVCLLTSLTNNIPTYLGHRSGSMSVLKFKKSIFLCLFSAILHKSPVPLHTGNMHVSLAEALEVRGGPLQEEEVWAVLSQSAESLQELFHKGRNMWNQVCRDISQRWLWIYCLCVLHLQYLALAIKILCTFFFVQ